MFDHQGIYQSVSELNRLAAIWPTSIPGLVRYLQRRHTYLLSPPHQTHIGLDLVCLVR